MVPDQVLKVVEPKVGDLGQDGTFAWYAIGHDAIESRDAVGCDKEVLVSQIKYFPHFARLDVFQPRKADIQTSGSTQ